MPAHAHECDVSTTSSHRHSYLNVGKFGNSQTLSGGSVGIGANDSTGYAGEHNHVATISETGNGKPHNNLSPFYVCYMWHRTA